LPYAYYADSTPCRYYEGVPINKSSGESNCTQMLVREAILFVNQSASNERPFFLYFAPDSTHAPHYASKEFLGQSKRGEWKQ